MWRRWRGWRKLKSKLEKYMVDKGFLRFWVGLKTLKNLFLFIHWKYIHVRK